MSGRPQMLLGTQGVSNWGAGDALSEYVVGDVVYVPDQCAAVLSRRCAVGLHRVEAVFSIGEDASFYYRLSPASIADGRHIKTDWNSCSDRIHVSPGNCDFTLGFIRLYAQPPNPNL